MSQAEQSLGPEGQQFEQRLNTLLSVVRRTEIGESARRSIFNTAAAKLEINRETGDIENPQGIQALSPLQFDVLIEMQAELADLLSNLDVAQKTSQDPALNKTRQEAEHLLGVIEIMREEHQRRLSGVGKEDDTGTDWNEFRAQMLRTPEFTALNPLVLRAQDVLLRLSAVDNLESAKAELILLQPQRLVVQLSAALANLTSWAIAQGPEKAEYVARVITDSKQGVAGVILEELKQRLSELNREKTRTAEFDFAAWRTGYDQVNGPRLQRLILASQTLANPPALKAEINAELQRWQQELAAEPSNAKARTQADVDVLRNHIERTYIEPMKQLREIVLTSMLNAWKEAYEKRTDVIDLHTYIARADTAVRANNTSQDLSTELNMLRTRFLPQIQQHLASIPGGVVEGKEQEQRAHIQGLLSLLNNTIDKLEAHQFEFWKQNLDRMPLFANARNELADLTDALNDPRNNKAFTSSAHLAKVEQDVISKLIDQRDNPLNTLNAKQKDHITTTYITPLQELVSKLKEVGEFKTVKEYLDEAHQILVDVENEERPGRQDSDEKFNRIKALKRKAAAIAEGPGGTPEEKKAVEEFGTESDARQQLYFTYVSGVKPHTMGDKRDYEPMTVSEDLSVNSKHIGYLINGESYLNSKVDANGNRVDARSQVTVDTIENESKTYNQTPVGNVMRYLDKVYRGAIYIEVTQPGSGERGPITGENVHYHLGFLLKSAEKALGYSQETVMNAFRLHWSILFHQSFFMAKSTPVISDEFFKMFRWERYARKYALRDTDAFMRDFIYLIFGNEGDGSRFSDKVANDIRSKLKENGMYHDYAWTIDQPLITMPIRYAPMRVPHEDEKDAQGNIITPAYTTPDEGWCFMPPLAYFKTQTVVRKTQMGLRFDRYQTTDGEFMYEAMPWNDLPSDAYQAYLKDVKTGPGPFVKHVLFGKPIEVTDRMSNPESFHSWRNMLIYARPMMRGICELSGDNAFIEKTDKDGHVHLRDKPAGYKPTADEKLTSAQELAQERVHVMMVIAGILYRTSRAEEHKRWDLIKIGDVLRAAVDSNFITHKDSQMINQVWVPIITVMLHTVIDEARKQLRFSK